MMFLLRVAFWLGVVLVLLPTGGTKDTSTTGQSSSLNTSEAVSAASATVDDMRHFCTRQPDACSVGSQAAVVIGQRAQAGAKMVLDFLNERYGSQASGPAGEKVTMTKSAGAAVGKSQQTLTPTDMEPAWRGPRPSGREIRHPV